MLLILPYCSCLRLCFRQFYSLVGTILGTCWKRHDPSSFAVPLIPSRPLCYLSESFLKHPWRHKYFNCTLSTHQYFGSRLSATRDNSLTLHFRAVAENVWQWWTPSGAVEVFLRFRCRLQDNLPSCVPGVKWKFGRGRRSCDVKLEKFATVRYITLKHEQMKSLLAVQFSP